MKFGTFEESVFFIGAKFTYNDPILTKFVLAPIPEFTVDFKILLRLRNRLFKSILIKLVDNRVSQRFDIVSYSFVGKHISADKFRLLFIAVFDSLEHQIIKFAADEGTRSIPYFSTLKDYERRSRFCPFNQLLRMANFCLNVL